MKNPLRCTLLALGLLSLNNFEYSLSAQMFDYPIKAKVWYFVRGYGDGESAQVAMDFGGTRGDYSFTSTTSMENGDQEAKLVELGKQYSFDITANNMAEYEFVFEAPPNMTVYLDGMERSVMNNQNDIVGSSFTVLVLPDYQTETVGFGLSPGLAMGKLIWKLGVGELSNGEPAGTVVLSQDDIDSAAYTPAALHYSENYEEVDVVLNNGALRQVFAPEGLLDIVTINASKYDIKVYDWSQVGAKANGLYTTTGSPMRTYTIDNPGDDGGKRIRIRKAVGTLTYETVAKQEADDDWEVKDWHKTPGNPVRIVFRDYQSATTSAIKVTKYNDTGIITQTDHTYTAGGAELSGRTYGTGLNALSTTYQYFTTGGMGQQGNPESTTLSCGNEIDYTWYTKSNYNSSGNKQGEIAIGEVHTMTRPFLDGKSTEGNIVTTYTYMTGIERPLVETITELATPSNKVIRDVDYIYTFPSLGGMSGVQIAKTEKYNQTTTAATLTKVYSWQLADSFLRNRIYSRENPDGTKTSYLYQRGSWNALSNTFTPGTGQYKRITMVRGLAAAVSGVTNSITTIKGGTIDAVHCVRKKSTSRVVVKDPSGAVIRTRDYVYNNSGTWTGLTAIKYTYDASRNLTRRERVEGSTVTTLYEASYVNDQLDYTIDEAGIKVTYTYDASGRVQTEKKIGWDDTDNFFDQKDITTTYFYDADGNVTKTEVAGQGNTEKIVTEYEYDKAKRRTKMIERGDGSERHNTLYTYKSCGNYLKITRPDGGTETRDYYTDGRPKSITGTAVPDRSFSYKILTSTGHVGYLSSKVTYEKSGSASDQQWEETYTDWMGRTVRVILPTHDGGNDVHMDYSYNSDGLLQKIETRTGTTSIAPNRLFAYDALKVLYREAVDTNNDGSIDTGEGKDRVTEYNYQYDYFTGQSLG